MQRFESNEVVTRKKLVSGLPETLGKSRGDIELRLMAYHPRAMIGADKGSEVEITRIFRKMTVYNPIPSQFGSWDGARSKNIPLERIIEDPVFRDSQRSYLIQLADCAAFALLKREVPPTGNIKKYGINSLFDEYLSPVCVKETCRLDPLGIVRR